MTDMRWEKTVTNPKYANEHVAADMMHQSTFQFTYEWTPGSPAPNQKRA